MQQRIALVTGGAGGIGTEICKHLDRQGRHVVAGYLPAEEQAAISWQAARRAEGLRIELTAGDVSLFESSADMVRDVQERIGPIDVLVNCAGITRDKTLQKMEKEQWQAVLSTNLDSVFKVGANPVSAMSELTQRNLKMWTDIQDNFLKAAGIKRDSNAPKQSDKN